MASIMITPEKSYKSKRTQNSACTPYVNIPNQIFHGWMHVT